MSPTYTMSAHLCKQIYSSWRQARQTSPDANPLPSPPAGGPSGAYFPRRSSSPEKRSMDNDRHDSHPSSANSQHSASNSSRWGSH